MGSIRTGPVMNIGPSCFSLCAGRLSRKQDLPPRGGTKASANMLECFKELALDRESQLIKI